MSESMSVGLDLGQSQDYSALAVVDHVRLLTADEARREARAEERGQWPPLRFDGIHEMRVVHLQRWQLGTAYDVIVKDVAELMHSPDLENSQLRFDATGVGRAVSDMFIQAFLQGRMGYCWPRPVTITGEARTSGRGTVTKRDLMSTLQVALQQNRLKIAEALPLRPVLEKELVSFRLKISDAGRDTYEFKRGQDTGHGDLTVAVALAARGGGWNRTEVLEP